MAKLHSIMVEFLHRQGSYVGETDLIYMKLRIVYEGYQEKAIGGLAFLNRAFRRGQTLDPL